MIIVVKGSRTQNTYNDIYINGLRVAAYWGKITSIEPEITSSFPECFFVSIGTAGSIGTDGFIHYVNEVVLDDFGAIAITEGEK